MAEERDAEPPEERWARLCVEFALPDVRTERWDRPPRQGVHDFNIMRNGRVFGACEVTAAADRDALKAWRIGNGREPWTGAGLDKAWVLSLDPGGIARGLRNKVPPLLRVLEQSSAVDAARAEAVRALHDLGVSEFAVVGNGPGRIFATVERPDDRIGGQVPTTGESIVGWLDSWLLRPASQRKVDKLNRSGLAERHICVLVPGLSDAPFEVQDLLLREHPLLPRRAPAVPAGLTHLWLLSTMSSGAVHQWGPDGWQSFVKPDPRST